MNFIIESTSKDKKGKSYTAFFQERIGCMNIMTSDRQLASVYENKSDAETERVKYFGTRRTVRVITHVSGKQNQSGSVRTGHDSGIF